MTDEELAVLDIGDHVTDRTDPDATMLVVGLPLERAASVTIDGNGTTVADVNPDYPAEDPVVEIVFAGSADTDVGHAKRYAYPRSRLERVTPIHSVDEGGSGASTHDVFPNDDLPPSNGDGDDE